ncbi:glycolipid 2-alpha-mannosyltransferase [Fragilaria crotonensis]|nr:glycolipid 2-alpha-mannosyltransferase [Fragilaria crotonensis]
MADWLWQHRQRAAPIVRRYFHLQPWLQARVDAANNSTKRRVLDNHDYRQQTSCLAVHIRLTDKASGRDKKGLDAYRPYMEAFAKAVTSISKSISSSSSVMKYSIYIATDDATVLPTIQNEWTPRVASRLVYQPNTFRSHDEDLPTFKLLAEDKHRSNTEALVDMYAMSKCEYFVHGYSGMAEAVVYINPKLHSKSVNIDDEERMTPSQFERMVRKTEEKWYRDSSHGISLT